MTALVIGSSAGGPVALRHLLTRLSPHFRGAIIVVSHLGQGGGNLLSEGLRHVCTLPVRVAIEREAIEAGVIHVAPEGYHLLIEFNRHFSYSIDERVSFSRPSIDVLFASAAKVYRTGLTGIVLSGANSDGAEGLRTIRHFGGRALVQDPHEAEMPTMPLAAISHAGCDLCAPVAELAEYINSNMNV